MKTAKLKCGCRYEVSERERWVEMCPKHEAEFQETHARWAKERKEVNREADHN